jgi:hypothetical protein
MGACHGLPIRIGGHVPPLLVTPSLPLNGGGDPAGVWIF